jgi:hypothetical protein
MTWGKMRKKRKMRKKGLAWPREKCVFNALSVLSPRAEVLRWGAQSFAPLT